MSSRDYIPSSQEPLRSWMENFDGLIGADAGRFGLLVDEAASIHARVQAFIDALALALGEETRNKGTVAAKSLAKVEMLQLIRPIAQRIRDNMGVAPEDKLLLGLTLPDTSPTPVAAPTTMPLLEVVQSQPLVHSIKYHDEATPTTKAKPDGAIGLQLYRVVSETPPGGPQGAQFIGLVTRQPFRMEFESADGRKTAYYWARWQTGKGLVGPWSELASRMIAA